MAEYLSVLNDPPKVLPGPQLLHHLVDFEKHGHICALDFTSKDKQVQYTYREVQSCVLSLAARILEALATPDPGTASVSRQSVIPILLPQSPGLYISQLAILESGCAFCPITLDAPKERIKFVIGDISANVVITTPEFKGSVSWENGPTVILVDDFPTVPKEGVAESVSRAPKSMDLAYVMYTSGSSGTPKGVAVSHLAVSQSLLAHETHIPVFKRFLQFAAPSFDVSVFEIFFTLKRGSTLVGCSRSLLLNDLPGMINKLRVDAAELTPTVVGSLLQKRANAPGLKLLLTIGEMLTKPIVEEFGGSEAKESILYGMYGPTEAAIHCTIHPKMKASTMPRNIGVPFDTVSAFIAVAGSTEDSEQSITLLPPGETGELVLGGSQLARGYLNREDQNKASFLSSAGQIYYRTGDKGRLLEDGTIEILGRISAGQVKLRGQRVELGEIEQAVCQQPGIKSVSAAVIGGSLVVFALVGGQSLKFEDVLETCSKWLPKYMLPNEIVFLPKFPYLPSGKVDKKTLESDYQEKRKKEISQGEVLGTTTDQIVKETLESFLVNFSTDMRLAAAGLDSLVAIRVASKLRSLGFDITTIAVLKAETMWELARLCGNAESTSSQPSKAKSLYTTEITDALNGTMKDVEYTMPCTPLQSAMLSETALNSKAYRNWVELDLKDISDVNQVISALHSLAEYNPILRTGFVESRDSHGYIQIVWKTIGCSQIDNVGAFNYDFDPTRDTSLHHPIRVQVRLQSSSIKVLLHLHHALYDAWSLELLLDDLDVLLKGEQPFSRPPFVNVVDGYLNGTLTANSWSSRDYWKDHLSNLDIRQIPNLHTCRNISSGLATSNLQTSIPTSEIEAAAKRLFSSPQSLFQAAYSLVLASYLGSSDICFGTVFSGRTLPISGIENIVGPCLTTLPIRVDISTSDTLQDLVQELNSTNRKHLEHSTVPLRYIKSLSGVDPGQPLFDTLIIWQQTLQSYEQARTHVFLANSIDNLELNLTLEIFPGLGDIELRAHYKESTFPSSQIDILLQQVEQLSQLIIRSEATSLESAFGALSKKLLSVENEAPQIALGNETLTSPVERIAADDPLRPAIDFAESIDGNNVKLQRMSYWELNVRSNQMAHCLLEHNALSDELICICLEKGMDLYASILAVAKIGVGYLPVTPDIPSERLHHILREAKVKIVMAHMSSRPLFKSFKQAQVLYVDDIDFSMQPPGNIPRIFSKNNLSYAVFTSGSTGTPKGVLVTQGNLLSNLDVLKDLYPSNKGAKLLQSCSQAFDVSVFEIFFTWRIGGCLCSAVKDVLFRDIEKTIRLLNITHLSLTPTVAALIDPENVPRVEFLVTAGEAVTQKVFNTWADKGLYQGYGPSEMTNICTLNPRVSRNDSIYNIGPPLKNTSAFVLSAGSELALVPRGGEGELCFGGSQVFRGYMDKSQEEGKIVEHPTLGRLYRSGDFGRLMHDGSLSFTRRKDDQVKIRGQRVELGEINFILLRSSTVRDCFTMMIDGDNGSSPRLVSFWTSEDQTSASLACLSPNHSALDSLYNNLESALPAYMIPTSLIPVSYLPSTSQGKIDKGRLAQLYRSLDGSYLNLTTRSYRSSSDHVWTDLELAIAEALSETMQLHVEDIKPDASFFSLGIDSISAIQFSRFLRQASKLYVEISDVLKYPSVMKLAERMSSQAPGKGYILDSSGGSFDFGFGTPFINSITERFNQVGKKVQKILPCTPLQEVMLSAAESSSGKTYSNQVLFHINCNLERLQACWRVMTQRHEILRTCFINTEIARYAYAQVVLEDFELIFGTVHEEDGRASSVQLSAINSQPPYSFDVIQYSGSAKLRLSMHHALYDGVALSILYEEVETLYKGDCLAPAPSFEPFLKEMTLMNKQESDKFWGLALNHCDYPKFERSNHQNETSIQRIRATFSLAWIEQSAKKHCTSLSAIFHSIWASLIAERLRATDVCFGNVVSGRTIPVDGIERLAAPCFNTIPCRLKDVHKLSYLEAFRHMQSWNAQSLPFHLTPLRRIQSKFGVDGSRLFDTLFILQPLSRDLDASIWSISEDKGAMDFPLVCEVVQRHNENTLEIALHSHSSVINEDDALTLLESFNMKLGSALENPRRHLLASVMREQIVSKRFNQEKKPPDLNRASNVMSTNELSLRDVLASFTDMPIENIQRDVSIFRLGLDSISAVQVASLLRKQGHNVQASDILEHPTIAKLSARLALCPENNNCQQSNEFECASFDKSHREAICAKHNLRSDLVEAIRPCTAVQQGMIAQSLHSQGQEYINSIWLELPPDSSLSTLKAAWIDACSHHEMLRTGFVSTDDITYPFAMITYAKEGFHIPWSEAADEGQLKAAIVGQLAQYPWRLSVRKQDSGIIARFTAHHALYDARSIQMILSDVANSYTSSSIPTRPSTLSLLCAILNDSNGNLAEKQQFWEREESKIIINRFPDLTPLRISDKTTFVQEVFSQVSSSELEESCRQLGATAQAAGQAAWARLLCSYIGESSTTFGMTLSGRSVHEDSGEISFPTIVTLPVRCEVSGTNEELLTRTVNSNALLHKHQFTPLVSIQKWMGYPEGKMFDSLFTFQKVPASQSEAVCPWRVIREEATADCAVSLEVQPTTSNKIVLRLTCRHDLIPVEHAELLLRQYDTILLDTLINPRNQCDIPPSTEMAPNLLSITPAKEAELPDSVTLLHEFIERGAVEWSEKRALEFALCLEPRRFESRSWTYEELNEKGNMVAHILLLRKLAPGDTVGIFFEKCAEASFAIIGILKAGCAFVALDPNAPADRLKFIVEDSGAKLILSAGKPAKNLKALIDKTIIALDSQGVFHGCSSGQPSLLRKLWPQDTCYCLYTSGTTGTPKGCLISHESAVQAMLSFQRLFAGHWAEDSKWLQFASFHFDVSVLEQFWSWSVGICVASAPRDLIFEDIPNAIRQLGITHIDLTPSLARLLLPGDVPSLCKGVFIVGGEQLKQEILDVWGEHACIYNGYGPTEATIGVTMFPRVPQNGKPANIGPQFDNVGSFVLKPNTTLPVLRGGIGELCVSGKLVGQGYLHRPDLTSERFPTLESFDERVYRTGDLVRILYDGSFIFLGRADDQVKLRGQRLELSEINEVTKKSMNDLDEVITLVLKHASQQKEQLVTFFVSSTEDPKAQSNLIFRMRDACKAQLPGYMVPTHFVPIKALPLNANNKADSKQLALIYNNLSTDDLQILSRATRPEKNWSNREKEILEIVAKALQVDISALARDSNIFELGLDSISIIGFSRSLQNSGLSHAKLSVVKGNSNIGAMVKALLSDDTHGLKRENEYLAALQNMAAFSQRHMATICQELGVDSTDIESIAPCTPVQQGMIYRFLESDRPLYFHQFEFLLDQLVDTARLRSAWKSVVSHLQVLRTKFVATEDGYAQTVLRDTSINLKDLNFDTATTGKTSALKNPFTFQINPDSKGKSWIRLFHGLYDGNSLSMLFQGLLSEYRSTGAFDYGPSFHSSLAYGPLARVAGAENFWRSHLRGWLYRPLPTRFLEAAEDVMVSRALPSLTGLEDFRKKLGVTQQAIFQATWISVLQTISSPDLTIGMVISGREIDFEGADKVIGPLFNTIPFNAKMNEGMTAKSLISICHEFNMRMQYFQHTPLNDIQKWIVKKPGQALFDSLFVFQHTQAGEEDSTKEFWIRKEEEQIADYPLSFEATLGADGRVSMTIVAHGSVITKYGAETLLGDMEKALFTVVEEGGRNVILDQEELSTSETELDKKMKPSSFARADSKPEPPPFLWTREAERIRAEVASLANADELSIKESTSIFELGLDSIDVIKLSSRLKKQGIQIPVSAIIRSQNISNMVTKTSTEYHQASIKSSGSLLQTMIQNLTQYVNRARVSTDDVEEILPATPLQQAMVKDMLRSNFTRYFILEAFLLDKNTETLRLATAVKRVVSESSILRSFFIEVDDPSLPVSYAQIVRRSSSSLSDSSSESSLESFMDSFKNVSAIRAASEGNMFQVRFISVGKKEYMIMAISHALYDGHSLQLLHQDIDRAYHGKLLPRPHPLPFLEEIFRSTTEDAKNFWRSTLSNLPLTKLPKKESPQLADKSKVNRLESRSRTPLKDIEHLCKSLRITLQTLGQTCCALLLAQLMRQLDVVFGSVLACRESEEANEVMFPLMNTVAVRSVLHGTFSEMLRYMQDMSDTTRQYQHFPLAIAQAFAFASRRHESPNAETALFDTLFIYQGRRSPASIMPLYESDYSSSNVDIPLCIEMEIVDGNYLAWTIACNSTIQNVDEPEEIVKMLDIILGCITAAPETATVVSDADGISICGLPKFRRPNTVSLKNVSQSLPTSEYEKWSDTELLIRKMLHVLSGVSEDLIRKDTTIFHLGLDSILVLKLPALLRAHGIKLNVSNILKDQTTSAMARSVLRGEHYRVEPLDIDAVLCNNSAKLDVSTRDDIEKEMGMIQNVMPATAGQVFMIRKWQISRGALYYPTFTLSFYESLDKAKLNRAWSYLLQYNDILRTGFIETESGILQVVFTNPQNDIIYVSSSPKLRRNQETLQEKSRSNLNYPPLKLAVEISGSAATLKLRIHHALYDGISLPILIEQLSLLYQGKELTTSSFKFKDFVGLSIHASTRTSSEKPAMELKVAREKWRSYLSQGPHSLTKFPTGDLKSCSSTRTENFRSSLRIPSLKRLAQDAGVSIDAILLTSMSKIYAQFLNLKNLNTSSQVVFGIFLANRAPFEEDFSELPVPTLNLLPLRVRNPLGRAMRDVAAEIQRDLHQISSEEMSSSSLTDIYAWTGVRVNFFVNILKDHVSEQEGHKGVVEKPLFLLHDTASKAEVMEYWPNEEVFPSKDGRYDAYLPSVDTEIRYHEGNVDIGIFAPTELLSVEEADSMIERFVGMLRS